MSIGRFRLFPTLSRFLAKLVLIAGWPNFIKKSFSVYIAQNLRSVVGCASQPSPRTGGADADPDSTLIGGLNFADFVFLKLNSCHI